MQQVKEEISQITLTPICQLVLDKNNPRKIDKQQFQKLIKSIESDPNFLYARPILVNRTNDSLHVYAGNQRVKAALKLAWKQIPCIIEDNIPPQLIKERIVKDNAHYGEHDWDMLANDWDLDTLLMSGLTEDDLHIGIDNKDEDKPKKEKKIKLCPHCGGDI